MRLKIFVILIMIMILLTGCVVTKPDNNIPPPGETVKPASLSKLPMEIPPFDHEIMMFSVSSTANKGYIRYSIIYKNVAIADNESYVEMLEASGWETSIATASVDEASVYVKDEVLLGLTFNVDASTLSFSCLVPD